MLSMMKALSAWLATTSLSATIQNVSWIIPSVQTVHILAIAALFSSVLLVDLRLLGAFQRREPLLAVVQRFLHWMWYVLAVLFVSGTLLIVGEPDRSLTNPAFGIKMALLLVVVLLTLLIARPLRRNATFWESSPGRRALAGVIGACSLLLWSGVIFAGRWIAYVSSY